MNNAFLELLAERNEMYSTMTKNIFFSIIKTVCDGIIEYMNDIGEINNDSQVTWEDIVWFPNEGDFCIIFATVKYQVGSTIMIDGKMVTLDEESAQSYQRIVRIGIPTTIAASAKEDVIKFLKSRKVLHESIDDIVENAKESTHQATPEFDLDQLSEEQRNALEMYLKGMH